MHLGVRPCTSASRATWNTCSTYAVRYGDTVLALRPASRRSRRSSHWNCSSCVICACAIVRASFAFDARQRERVAEIGGQQQRQRARRPLLGAAVRILDQIARAFAEADQRRRRQLDVQPAERRRRRRPAASASRVAFGGRCRRTPPPFPARPALRPGSTSSNASVSPPSRDRHLHARACRSPWRARRTAPRRSRRRRRRRLRGASPVISQDRRDRGS